MLIKALRSANAPLAPNAHGMPLVEAAPASPYQRKLVRLAFLAPDLQASILAGAQPEGLTLEQLMRMPIAPSWADQRASFEALR